MKLKLIVLNSLFLVCSLAGFSQLNVTRISSSAVPETREGIFYSLPRTVVKIEVRIDRVENYKGPYADYALRLLGLKNVVTANSVEYKISAINITTAAEPDPDQYYFIEPGEKMSKNEQAGLFSLGSSGVILGTIAQESMDTDVAKPVTGIADNMDDNKDSFGELFKYSADISVFEKVDTIIRKISLDTMTVERQFYKRTVVEKSPDQKAKEAADFISKIKENRFNLISGVQEVNYNQETLEYMDTQLKTMEKEYLKLFTGVSLSKTMTFSYKYIPVPNQVNTEIPVFKFIKSKGVVDLDEPGGKVVTIKVQRVGNTNAVSAYLSQAVKTSKQQGLTYRIPEVAKVTVKFEDVIQETQCLINQLGVVASLPVNKWKVMYHPETGGIKSFEN
jgi:hypothetical protein